MPFDGSGNFTLTNTSYTGTNVWEQAFNADDDVRADQMDGFSRDLAAGFEAVLTRDGQNSPSANLPMNAKKHTGVANATDRTDYAAYGQLLDATGQFVAAANVGGTGNAITLTPSTAITAYAANQSLTFVVKTANGGPTTVAVSGLSAVSLTKNGAIALAAGDLAQGALITIRYDGTRFQVSGGIGGGSGTFSVNGAGFQVGSIQDTDQFVIADDSNADNNARVLASTLRNYALGDATGIEIMTETEYNNATKVANTIYLVTG